MQCSYENEDQWVLDGAALYEFEERLSWERPAISWFSLHILRQKLCSSWVHFRYQPDTAPSPLLLTISSIMKHTTSMFFEFPIEFTEFSRSQEMRPKASEFLSAASALTFQHRPRHTCIEKPSDPSVMLRDISTIIYNLPSFIVNAYRRGTTKPHSLLRFSGPFHAVCLHYSDPFQCVCQTPAWERGKRLLCFAKLWSLDGFYSINGDNDGLRYAQIGGVVFEKTTECISFHWVHQNLSIYTVYNICNTTTAPLFVCSNEECVAKMCHPWSKNRMSNLSRL